MPIVNAFFGLTLFVLPDVSLVHAFQKTPERLKRFFRDEVDNPSFGDNGHFLTCLQEELFPDILRYHHLKFRGYGCSAHFSSKKYIESKIVKQ